MAKKLLKLFFLFSLTAVIVLYNPLKASSQTVEANDNLLFLNPGSVKIDVANKLIYIAHEQGLTILDAENYNLVKKILYGRMISSIYIDNINNRFYLLDQTNQQIIFLPLLPKNELLSRTEEEIVKSGFLISVGNSPDRFFVNQKGGEVHIFCLSNSSIVTLSLKENKIIKTTPIKTPIDGASYSMIYSEKQNKIYFEDRRQGQLRSLNLASGKLNIIDKAVNLSTLTSQTVNNAKNELYLFNLQTNALEIASTKTDIVKKIIPLNKFVGRIFFIKELNKLILISWRSDEIEIFDLASKKIEKTLPLGIGADPYFLLFNSLEKSIYLIGQNSYKLFIIDTRTWEIEKTLETPPLNSVRPLINPANGDFLIRERNLNSLLIIKKDYSQEFLPPKADQPSSQENNFGAPINIVSSPKFGLAYVLNNLVNEKYQSKVTALKSQTNELIWEQLVGRNARQLIIDETNNKLFINNADDNTLTVLNPKNGDFIRNIEVGKKPYVMDSDVKNGRIFVLNIEDGTLYFINTKSDSIAQKIKINQTEPCYLFYDPLKKNIYVLSINRVVTVINNSGEIIGEIKLPLTGGGFPQNFIQASPDFSKIYIFTVGGAIYQFMENKAYQTIRQDSPGNFWSYALNDSKNGMVYIINEGNNTVSRFNTRTAEITDFIKLAEMPFRLILAEEPFELFVVTKKGNLLSYDQNGFLKNTVILNQVPSFNIYDPVNKKIVLADNDLNSVVVYSSEKNKIETTLNNATVMEVKKNMPEKNGLLNIFSKIYSEIRNISSIAKILSSIGFIVLVFFVFLLFRK